MFKILYKEKNISSFNCIKKYAKDNNIKKIGHSGTLDVLAQGLLLIATNDDTKLINFIKNKTKEYRVSCQLGFQSETYDEEGPISFVSSKIPTNKEIENTLFSFLGKQKQLPPKFSAKKINGKRAYKLAREKKEFRMQNVEIEIFNIYNIIYNYPILSFSCHVSNGTYIRSLINDIGNKLETGAYMNFLERTKVHDLKLNDEINVNTLLGLESINLLSELEVKKWFEGKIKEIKQKDGWYLIEYKKYKIIGIVNVKNKKISQLKLFGNRIKKILENKYV